MRTTLLSFLLLSSVALSAQIYDPVQWNTRWEPLEGGAYELIFEALIEPGWTIYSQYLESDDGPVRTSFSYDEGAHFTLEGKNREEGEIKSGYDNTFEMEVIKIYGPLATFRQKVIVGDPSLPISGYLEFMVCNDEMCLPPKEVEFSFQLEGAAAGVQGEQPEIVIDNPFAGNIVDVEEAGTAPAGGQLFRPVSWSADIAQIDATTYDLLFTADLQDGWSIYSQFTEDNGPFPTNFSFEPGAGYNRLGQVAEAGNKKEGMDAVFKVNVIKYLGGSVTFTQRISVSDPARPVAGYLTYMACDDERCLMPTDVDFRFLPATGEVLLGDEARAAAGEETLAAAPALELLYGGFTQPDLEQPVGACGNEAEGPVIARTSNARIFLLGLLGGFLALLTPCVFPMIPLTVSFFTKGQGQSRSKGLTNASLYGFFILAVYLLLSVPFHLMDSVNPDILNDISTNVWLNVGFFVIFLFFAFSFFGYYELTLPSSWANRVSKAEGIGGILGIFFMALTLALVSFSCTGPILGSLLAGALSSDGGAWQLTAGMAGFGVALALPFALFAAFPSMMNALPKSGGWLNTVKVVLGFLEVALALKFLSNADLVKHWGLLRIEPFLILWILTFGGMALYLFGLIRFPHDGPLKKLPPARIGLGILTTAFVIYLAGGFRYDRDAGSYHSLKLLSGLAPPVCYSFFQPCDCPQNLSCFKDLETGLEYAREVNKPVLLDFTGYACVNCRMMEEHVWPEPQVDRLLRNEYVLISLYVDDKQALPEAEQIEVQKSSGGARKLRDVGDKWSHFQTEFFQTNSQPYYVLLSPEGQLLTRPVGYTPDADKYERFLQCGVDAFERLARE